MPTRRALAGVLVAAALVAAGCAEDDTTGTAGGTTAPDEPATGGSDGTSGATATTEAVPSGPAPGVDDESIKIGITFVDTEAIAAVGLDYELGDHRAVYTALIDAINADGGIHGRMLDPAFAPVDPTSPAPAEEACVRLTEDHDAFLLTGFFLGDAVLCPLDTYETAVVGGQMTPERIARAKAPWITWDADTDLPRTVVATFDERGLLGGRVAVLAHVNDQDVLDVVQSALDDLGIEPVEVAVADAPTDDTAALQANIRTIAERFKAADADTVLFAGVTGGTNWLVTMAEDDSYRPQLLFTSVTAPRAFATSEATTDTTILEGSLSGGLYGPDQARFGEPVMQECIATLADAGIDTPSPDESGDDPSNQPYQAAFQACPDIALVRAVLEEAGEQLNYGTLAAAVDGLEVTVPGDPTPRVYGPPPAGDGDPAAYLYGWDEAAKDFVLAEGS